MSDFHSDSISHLPTYNMDAFAGVNGVVASLAQLRANALLAFDTSGGKAVSRSDIARLEALVAGAFGVPLDHIDFAALGSAPAPDGPIMHALLQRLPGPQAANAHAFLVDLHRRVHDWLTN